MLRSALWYYSDAYLLLNGTITITGGPEDSSPENKSTDKRDKGVIFKNCAPFIKCTSKINITQIDYIKDLDVVMHNYAKDLNVVMHNWC